jgi:hypothetical protein
VSAVKIVEFVFILCFGGLLVGGLFVLAFGAAHIFVTVVRLWYPNFCLLVRPQTEKERDQNPHEVKLLAIDMCIRARIDAQKRAARILHEQIHGPLPVLGMPKMTISPIANKSMEWDLSEVRPVMNPPPALPTRHDRERKDLWTLVRYGERGLNHPQYMCRKTPTRSGLKIAWAACRSERILLPLDSAQRLSAMVEGSVILPGNVWARKLLKERKISLGREEHATVQ